MGFRLWQSKCLLYDRNVNPEEIGAQIASGNLHNWCNILKREFGRLLEV